MLKSMERREFYRHPLHLPIQMSMGENSITLNADVKDISLGGLSFLTPMEIPKGNKVTVRIVFRERVYLLKTLVTYSRETEQPGIYQNGVQFSCSPLAFRALLTHLFFEIYEHHRFLRQSVDPEISEEAASDQWLRENTRLFAA